MLPDGRPAGRTAADAGFTLLEVLVAFVIVAAALAVLFRTAVEGRMAADVAARTQEALSRARSHLAVTEAGPLRAGDRGGDDGGYRWRVRIAAVAEGAPAHDGPPSPTLYAIAVAVSWGEGAAARGVTIETRRLAPPAPRPP